jgi:hypothetical protein
MAIRTLLVPDFNDVGLSAVGASTVGVGIDGFTSFHVFFLDVAGLVTTRLVFVLQLRPEALITLIRDCSGRRSSVDPKYCY